MWSILNKYVPTCIFHDSVYKSFCCLPIQIILNNYIFFSLFVMGWGVQVISDEYQTDMKSNKINFYMNGTSYIFAMQIIKLYY